MSAAQGPIDNLVDHLSDPYHVTFACASQAQCPPKFCKGVGGFVKQVHRITRCTSMLHFSRPLRRDCMQGGACLLTSSISGQKRALG